LNKSINTQKIEDLFEGSPEDLAEFIKVILAQFEEYKKEVTSAVKTRNQLAVKDLRHKIKSICLSFDVPFILESLQEIMVVLEVDQNDELAVNQKLQLVLQELDEVVEELIKFQSK